MTLTLSPLEAISRTKKKDTRKTNVFIRVGRTLPRSCDEHKRTGSSERKVVLLPSSSAVSHLISVEAEGLQSS